MRHSGTAPSAGRVTAVLLTLAALFAACRNERPDEQPVYCGFAAGKLSHACGHGGDEPSGSVIAAPGESVTPPLLRKTHEVFDIELVPEQGEFAGRVAFLPARSGAYGIFFGSPVSLELEDAHGRDLTIEYSTDNTHCSHFANAYVAALEADTPVTLRIAPTSQQRLRLLVERLGSNVDAVLSTDCSQASGADAAAGDADSSAAPLRDAGSVDTLDARVPPDDVGDTVSDAAPVDSGSAPDAQTGSELDASSGLDSGTDASPECRTDGPCVDDSECCGYCHDQDHCH